MLAYKGTSPEVRFQATTDYGTSRRVAVDDVALNVCTSSTNTTGDYGDLPSSYGVAWHTGRSALKLGATWTADTTFAAGSDLSDDGVSFVGNFTPGLNATMRVNVQGTPLNGRWLHVWFDWNRNGIFGARRAGA